MKFLLLQFSTLRSQAIAIAFCAAVAVVSTVGPVAARGAPDSFADLSERLSPAVVNVSTKQTVKTQRQGEMPQFPPGSPFEDLFRDFFDQQQGQERSRKVSSLGSGFVIDPSGIVVTNNHVIGKADEISVNLSDGTQLEAELIGRDQKTDLAVLRVKTDKPLPYVSFGTSEKMRVGDWVLAIGNPFGLGGSVSAGIISAQNRNINSGPYDAFIQTDAAINRGNSGGPLFNMDGEVIGVNTAIISPSGGSIGIGFAIPADIAKKVVTQLQEYGETRRGWLGVRIQTVTDELAESFGLDKARGALVAEITPNGPAERAGIKTGDVILRFGGENVPEMRDLPRIVAETPVGDDVDVVVWRDGEKKNFEVTLGRLEEFEKAEGLAMDEADEAGSEIEGLGLKLSAMNNMLREQFGIPDDVNGVVIVAVDPASAAAEKGIRPGDVIVQVEQQEGVRTPAEVLAKVRAVREADRKSVLLLLNRGGDLRFVAVRLAES